MKNETLQQIVADLGGMAPNGYVIALHFRFAAATFVLQTYTADWAKTYSRESLVLRDPLVAWSLNQTGRIRWSALADQDVGQVLQRAAAFGLVYGVGISHESQGSRSLFAYARDDREYTDAEIRELEAKSIRVHEMTQEAQLSEADRAWLRVASVDGTRGA
ncbi:MAG: autoinducer binding domain-containing protein [Shimia sp.]